MISQYNPVPNIKGGEGRAIKLNRGGEIDIKVSFVNEMKKVL